MSDITLEQVWQLIQQLEPEERDTLVTRLQNRSSHFAQVTLATIMAERKRRLESGESVSGLPSLRNAYAAPDFDVSDEQLRRSIRDAANEWEQELDDFGPTS